ncbi:LysR family transcriptional regulator [Acuticoccus mangrovi]|uniref:LysR family transcriptional regulator n=1 Tax=Acuticoccus mangrovi TaxID=2796142 RepID=A0A934IR49_9HYPH|nr:LysR family transcriptional regulator [Acuticoccus mangrovi]MBJ3777140.1 LysR family transcriptional regulator [Acuticoccus mangrovi]
MHHQCDVFGFNVSPDQLGRIVTFVAVAERRSFSGAADALNLTSSSVSRRISQLEEELGVQLIVRTTRRVALSELGETYLAECRSILARLSEANDEISARNAEPRGVLRISLPVAFGRRHVAPVIARFLATHPKVSIDASFSDVFVDLVKEGFDLAVRIGTPTDSSVKIRAIAPNTRILMASPDYLEAAPPLTAPSDLSLHSCIRYNRYASAGNLWSLSDGNANLSVPISGTFRCDDSEAVHEAALAGLGVGLVPRYIGYRNLQSGRLVNVLPGWHSVPEAGIYVAYPSARHLAPKVRAFIDHLAAHFRHPSWDA